MKDFTQEKHTHIHMYPQTLRRKKHIHKYPQPPLSHTRNAGVHVVGPSGVHVVAGLNHLLNELVTVSVPELDADVPKDFLT